MKEGGENSGCFQKLTILQILMMFGWIRGLSEDLDYTRRSATALLHNPVASLFALSLPVCLVVTEMFPTTL